MKGGNSGIHIHFTNRWLYSLISIGIILVLSVGVYAWASANGVGHDYTELQPCSNGQILKTSSGAWACGTDVDTDTRCSTSGTCSQVCIGSDCRTSWPSGLTGGSANYVTKWTGASSVGNSIIYDTGTNVGIGTNSPGSKLTVYAGEIGFAGNIARITTADNVYFDIQATNSGGAIRLATGGSTATNTRLYIDPSGNVGIGILSPSQKLDVNGYVKGTGLCIGSDCRNIWPGGITTETDPTVIASVKDGVSWSEVGSKPAGFADDIDNVGTCSPSCNPSSTCVDVSTVTAGTGYKTFLCPSGYTMIGIEGYCTAGATCTISKLKCCTLSCSC